MMKHILFNNPSNIYLEKILIIKTHLVALHIILSFLFYTIIPVLRGHLWYKEKSGLIRQVTSWAGLAVHVDHFNRLIDKYFCIIN